MSPELGCENNDGVPDCAGGACDVVGAVPKSGLAAGFDGAGAKSVPWEAAIVGAGVEPVAGPKLKAWFCPAEAGGCEFNEGDGCDGFGG